MIRKIHGKYLWDHFQCKDSFVSKFLQAEMKWTLRHSTRPGKKTPDNIQQILTDTFFRLVWTISNSNILPVFLVNSDQTLVQYSAGAVRGTAWYSLATRGLVLGGGVGGGVRRMVHCNGYSDD